MLVKVFPDAWEPSNDFLLAAILTPILACGLCLRNNCQREEEETKTLKKWGALAKQVTNRVDPDDKTVEEKEDVEMVAKVDEEKEGGGEYRPGDAVSVGGEKAVIDAEEKEEAAEPKDDSSPYARKTYTIWMFIGLLFHFYDVFSDFQFRLRTSTLKTRS